MAIISRTAYKTECNLFGHPNVIDATNSSSSGTPQTNYYLFLTLNNLMLTKPNWRFKGTSYHKTNNVEVITAFQIIENDEVLGTVGIDYKGRNEKIKVRNPRIDAKRERGNGYYTDEPAKAELAIRKHFFKLAKDERIKKAADGADAVLTNEHRQKEWGKRHKKQLLLEQSEKFALTHMSQYLQENPGFETRHKDYMDARAEFSVVESVKKAFDSDTASLVVLDGAQYIVKVGDDTKTYTDDTLTFDLRKKIGLLKLVQDQQMISDVGCRVDSSTFVLLPEVKEQSDE